MSNRIQFRMIASFYEESGFKGEPVVTDYMVHATLIRARNARPTCSFTMTNAVSGEVLTYPADRERMSNVLPDEYWPQFVRDLIGGPSASQDQPTLFGGKGDTHVSEE